MYLVKAQSWEAVGLWIVKGKVSGGKRDPTHTSPAVLPWASGSGLWVWASHLTAGAVLEAASPGPCKEWIHWGSAFLWSGCPVASEFWEHHLRSSWWIPAVTSPWVFSILFFWSSALLWAIQSVPRVGLVLVEAHGVGSVSLTESSLPTLFLFLSWF